LFDSFFENVTIIVKQHLEALKKFSSGVRSGKLLQKQAFFLLYDFAYRICVRYSDMETDPDDRVYEGFAIFFSGSGYERAGDLDEMKAELKKILIRVCIKKESLSSEIFDTDTLDKMSFDARGEIKSLSASQQMINVLRRMPFKLRTVYNMSVIDGFSDHEVSLALNIPSGIISTCLFGVRSRMKGIFQNVKLVEAT
jgi:DNA-directed RNA polymerase specialized sigma24 family protein